MSDENNAVDCLSLAHFVPSSHFARALTHKTYFNVFCFNIFDDAVDRSFVLLLFLFDLRFIALEL